MHFHCKSDANRYILPAFEYQKPVAQSVAAVKAAGGRSVEGKRTLGELTTLIDEFGRRTDKLAIPHELWPLITYREMLFIK